MLNNSYNREIKKQVEEINRRFLNYQQATDKIVNDSEVSLTGDMPVYGGAYVGNEAEERKKGGCCVGRAIGSGKKAMEGAGLFDRLGDVATEALPLMLGGKKRGRPSKKGAGFGSIMPLEGLFGLGKEGGAMSAGKKRGRPAKKGAGLLDLIGLGKEGGAMSAGAMSAGAMSAGKKRGRPAKKGGSLIGSLVPGASLLGLGKAEEEMTGGGFFDSVLSVANNALDVAPAVLDIASKVKGLKGGKKPSKWIEHVKAYSKKHNMSYMKCLKDPKCKASYKK